MLFLHSRNFCAHGGLALRLIYLLIFVLFIMQAGK